MGNLLTETSTTHFTHEQELVYHMCMTNAHEKQQLKVDYTIKAQISFHYN